MGAQRRAGPVDRRIAALAERQHGVVSRAQLRQLGLERGAINRRLAAGRLHPLHRAVFAVGHRVLSREARWMAAVLAIGPDAVLSHRSAAALWRMRSAAGPRVEVTTPRKLRARAGIRVHEATLAFDEVTVRCGIPVTTPPRTLLDLARVLGPAQVERAATEAEVLRLFDALSLADMADRHAGRPGAAVLRRIATAGRLGATVTRSELEDRFLILVDAHGLPRPAVNASLRIGGGRLEVDCVWRDARVAVELDGYASHATRAAFERDRARDRRLQAAGWRVLRVTWQQLHRDGPAVARELRAVLARGRG